MVSIGSWQCYWRNPWANSFEPLCLCSWSIAQEETLRVGEMIHLRFLLLIIVFEMNRECTARWRESSRHFEPQKRAWAVRIDKPIGIFLSFYYWFVIISIKADLNCVIQSLHSYLSIHTITTAMWECQERYLMRLLNWPMSVMMLNVGQSQARPRCRLMRCSRWVSSLSSGIYPTHLLLVCLVSVTALDMIESTELSNSSSNPIQPNDFHTTPIWILIRESIHMDVISMMMMCVVQSIALSVLVNEFERTNEIWNWMDETDNRETQNCAIHPRTVQTNSYVQVQWQLGSM